MSPPIDRDIQVKFRFSAEERQMLEQLANAAGVNPTDYVRTLLRRTYAKEFNVARPPRETEPTFDGLIRDLVARDYTAGVIAARMGVSLGAVLAGLDVLQRLRLVEHADGSGFNATWEAMAASRDEQRVTVESMLSAARAKGFVDLDEALEEWPEKDRAYLVRRASQRLRDMKKEKGHSP